MATLQVRNLPDDVHETLRRRAARQGVSLTTLVAAVLAESAAEPTTEEWLAARGARRAAAGDDEPAVDVAVLAALDAARDEHDPR